LLPLLITFFVCIFWNIEFGIILGIGISLLMVLFPMARPGLKVHYVKARDYMETSDDPDREIVVLEPAQGLTFPGVEYIKDKVMKHGVYEKVPKAIVLDASHFADCDYTMVQGVSQIVDYFAKHKLTFVIAGCSDEIRGILILAKIKDTTFYESKDEALQMIFAPEISDNSQDPNGNGYDNKAADYGDEKLQDDSV